MAEEVKGFEIHLSLNAEEVNKGLKKVSSELSEQQKKLKDINAKLRYDPKNTSLLNEKTKILNQTIEATKNKLKLMNDKLAQSAELLKSGKISDREFKAVQASVEKTKTSLQTLNLELYKTNKEKWEGIQQLGGKLKMVSAIALATATAISALVKKGVSSLANGDEYSLKATPEQIESAKELTAVIKDIRSSLTAVTGDIAKSVLPLMKQLSEFVSDKLAPAISDMAKKFGSLPEAVQKIIIGASGLLVITPTLIENVGKLGTAVTNVLGGSSKGLLGLVMAHPAITAVLVALAGLFAYGYSTSDEFRQSVGDLAKSIKDTLGSALAVLKGYFEEIKPYLKDTLDVAVKVLGDALNIITKVVNAVKPLITSLMKLQTTIQSKVTSAFLDAVQRALNFIEPIVDGIGEILDLIEPVFDFISGIVDKVTEFSDSMIGDMISDIKTLLKPLNDFFDRLENIKESMIGKAVEWLVNEMKEIGEFFQEVGDNMGKWFSNDTGYTYVSPITGGTLFQPLIDNWNDTHGNLPMMANRAMSSKTFNVTINTTADHMSLDDLDRQLGDL